MNIEKGDKATDASHSNVYILLRFVSSLKPLLRVSLPVLALILISAGLPQFYLWYVGETVRCLTGEFACSTKVMGFTLPLSFVGLGVLTLTALVTRIGAWLIFELTGMWSTNALHDRMIGALARTRTTWFDETPSGHVLNRILGDFGNLRNMGIIRIGDACNAVAEVVAIAILVGIVNPWVAAAIVPAFLIYLYLQFNIGPMLGHAQEIASSWKGEVIHRETDLIEGQRIFSLYQKEHALLLRLSVAYRRFADATLMMARVSALSRLWVRVISACYGFLIFAFIAIAVDSGHIEITWAAVVASAVFALTSSLSWLSWCLTYLTETLGNARRVFELVDRPCEEDEEHSQPAASAHPLTDSALSGDIQFQDLTISYRADLPPVLNGLTLAIPASKRTGIIGRTGAGKSSLVQALFRMVHVHAGDIAIGRTSIYDVDLPTLRRQFGVVPQDPYLFSGTVRDNLDRAHEHDDLLLRKVLERVELQLELDQPVNEGGRNFSVGERQLLCIARVLLANKPYILMDEPTSAVDSETDAKLQRILGKELTGCTVITIAHRLDTLRSYDWIVEMDGGRLRRAGPPSEFFA